MLAISGVHKKTSGPTAGKAGLGLRLVGLWLESTSGHIHQPTGRLFTQARSNLALIAL